MSSGTYSHLRKSIWDAWGGECAYCGGKAKTIDHIQPRWGRESRSGDGIRNLVPACIPCNLLKSTHAVRWFLAQRPDRLGRILQWQAMTDEDVEKIRQWRRINELTATEFESLRSDIAEGRGGYKALARVYNISHRSVERIVRRGREP